MSRRKVVITETVKVTSEIEVDQEMLDECERTGDVDMLFDRPAIYYNTDRVVNVETLGLSWSTKD